MVERGANIDIVFRNGLKDYEVLPPPEVWDNIHPAVRRKLRPFVIFRVAALIAAVLSLSFLAVRWSRLLSPGIDNSVVVLNVEAAYPINYTAIDKPLSIDNKSKNHSDKSSYPIIQNLADNNIIPEMEKISTPDAVYVSETNIFPEKKAESLHEPMINSTFTAQNSFADILTIDQDYMPDVNTVKDGERWSISALASPTYYSKFNVGGDALSRQLMASEQNLTSYSGGVAFAYKINKKFSIQSGIYYSSVGQMVDGISSFGGFQKYDYTKGDHNFEVLTSSGTVYTNNADVFLTSTTPVQRILTVYTNDVFDPKKANLQYINNSLRQSFSYLELPVVMKYKFLDKTIDLNLIGGLSYNMLISNSVFTMINGVKYSVGKTEGLNPISLSSTLGMGMEYNFSKKLSLNLEPTFRYYLNPYNQSTASKFHPYSFGLFSGVSYKF